MTVPQTMSAAIWNGPDTELTVENVPVPQPGAGEVLVKVAACGVCHTDLHVMKGEVKFPAPGVLGHEISGEVVRLGEAVTTVCVGDRVVGAFIMPCGRCDRCAEGRDDLCELFYSENRLKGNLFDGTSRLSRGDGTRLSMYSMAGLAEYAVVPETGLARLPESLPLKESAILGCAAFTAYGAISRAEMELSGQPVAVVAVGGVGSSLVQFARHFGAKPIIAVDVEDEKLTAAGKLGADVLVNSRTMDAQKAVLEATDGRGVALCFEVLGRPQTVELGLSLLRAGGRLVVVGIAAGDSTADVPITPLVRRGTAVMGSFGARTREHLPQVVAHAAAGAFDVHGAVSQEFPLADAARAYSLLGEGRIRGRAIISMR